MRSSGRRARRLQPRKHLYYRVIGANRRYDREYLTNWACACRSQRHRAHDHCEMVRQPIETAENKSQSGQKRQRPTLRGLRCRWRCDPCSRCGERNKRAGPRWPAPPPPRLYFRGGVIDDQHPHVHAGLAENGFDALSQKMSVAEAWHNHIHRTCHVSPLAILPVSQNGATLIS
jgi:hypothetical protein